MSKPAKLLRVRVHARVALDVGQRLASYCAATRTTERAVVEAALRQYLDNTSDMSLLLRRHDRLGRAQARTQRDLEILSQAFATFIRLWFAHTPAVSQDARKAVQASAEGRYRQFVDYVADEFAAGKRFIDDLPQERIADEGELASLTQTREKANPEPPGASHASSAGRSPE